MRYTPGVDGPAYLRARSAECLGLALGKPDRPARPRPAPSKPAASPLASGSGASKPKSKDAFGFSNLPKPRRLA